MNRSREDRVAIRTADETMLREGSRIFVLALGRDDPAAEDHLFAMSKLLADGGCGHFIGASLGGRMVGYGALVTYEHLGWIAFMGTEPGQPVPEVTLAADLPDWYLVMDRRAFGEDRSKLLKLILKDGGKLLLAGEDGFGVLHGRKLGPLVANGIEPALRILWRAGDLGARVIYVPLHPGMPRAFVEELRDPEPEGKAVCCVRMVFGEPVDDEYDLVFAAHSTATG